MDHTEHPSIIRYRYYIAVMFEGFQGLLIEPSWCPVEVEHDGSISVQAEHGWTSHRCRIPTHTERNRFHLIHNWEENCLYDHRVFPRERHPVPPTPPFSKVPPLPGSGGHKVPFLNKGIRFMKTILWPRFRIPWYIFTFVKSRIGLFGDFFCCFYTSMKNVIPKTCFGLLLDFFSTV